MTKQEYFGKWLSIIDFKELDNIIKRIKDSNISICPLSKDIFKAFNLCSLENLRVVIIGQDPYPTLRNGKPIATGIAFANSKDTPEEEFSPSLDVLKESVIDFTIPHRYTNFDASLENWEEQGVLLLNTALTCETGKIGSHGLLWRPFIKSLLLNLSKSTVGIVYVLMGSSAQSFESYINKDFNHIIKVRHPSFYARTKTLMPSEIWKQINSILIGQNGYGIEWYKEN